MFWFSQHAVSMRSGHKLLYINPSTSIHLYFLLSKLETWHWEQWSHTRKAPWNSSLEHITGRTHVSTQHAHETGPKICPREDTCHLQRTDYRLWISIFGVPVTDWRRRGEATCWQCQMRQGHSRFMPLVQQSVWSGHTLTQVGKHCFAGGPPGPQGTRSQLKDLPGHENDPDSHCLTQGVAAREGGGGRFCLRVLLNTDGNLSSQHYFTKWVDFVLITLI